MSKLEKNCSISKVIEDNSIQELKGLIKIVEEAYKNNCDRKPSKFFRKDYNNWEKQNKKLYSKLLNLYNKYDEKLTEIYPID